MKPVAIAPSSSAATLVEALRRLLGAELVETHISWVLLDGRTAWKIKKPVRLPFLDASSLDVRRRLCEEELRLNRRYAPGLYLGVVGIYGTPQAPCLEPVGAPIEYAVRMRQFEADALWSTRIAQGRLAQAEVDGVARTLAAFHARAQRNVPAGLGTPESIEAASASVLDALGLLCGAKGEAHQSLGVVRAWMEAQAARLPPVWRARRGKPWGRAAPSRIWPFGLSGARS